MQDNVVNKKLVFDGLYSNDQAKFNGVQVNRETKDLYVGAFNENKKKGFGIQLYL